MEKHVRRVNGFNALFNLSNQRENKIQNQIMWSFEAIDLTQQDMAKSKMKVMDNNLGGKYN